MGLVVTEKFVLVKMGQNTRFMVPPSALPALAEIINLDVTYNIEDREEKYIVRQKCDVQISFEKVDGRLFASKDEYAYFLDVQQERALRQAELNKIVEGDDDPK